MKSLKHDPQALDQCLAMARQREDQTGAYHYVMCDEKGRLSLTFQRPTFGLWWDSQGTERKLSPATRKNQDSV
jgi:hypothetical protein